MLYGKALIKEKKFKEALEFLTKINTKSLSPAAHYYLGVTYENLGDSKHAIDSFKACLKIDFDHFRSTLQLGNLFLKLKVGERAEKYLKRAE